MTHGSLLLALTLATPLVMLVSCVSMPARLRMRTLLPIAPVPGLLTALVAAEGSVLALPDALFGLRFMLDKPAALLLGGAALLWIAAGVYAVAYRREVGDDGRFVIWWLATLIGNLGIFIAADLPSFYLFFAMVSLAAYWLVVDDGTPSARRAGAVYVSLALLGEAFLLLAFVLLAAHAPDNTLMIRDAVASLSHSPVRDAVIACLIFGFGIKIGLVPLHVWMPLTYTAAPIPVAAVLSGAGVKAGVIGLIRFLPFEPELFGWGEAFTVLGLVSAFYGVTIGITQKNPKTILAYSSISQMGVIAAVLGMGLATGDRSVAILVAFYALHHILVKGGLFLAVGIAGQSSRHRLWLVLLPAAIIALGLGGLPLTGGALAKIAIKEPLGYGLVGTLAMLSAACSTLLMLHFLHRLSDIAAPDRPLSAALLIPWLTVAFAAIAVPWALFPEVTNTSLQEAFAVKAIWDSLWPVLLGGAAAALLYRVGRKLPDVPAGDIINMMPPILSLARNVSGMAECLDMQLRQWPVAGAMFLLGTLALAGLFLSGVGVR